MSTTPRVSILLPTWNGERDLERLLPALAAQEGAEEVELLATDSSSEDRSVELLRAAGAAVEVIPKAEFGHGATRNALARRARGEVLVFLSQDALPVGNTFLRALVEPLAESRVAGSYARVLPGPDDDPLTARTVLAADEAGSEPVTRSLEGVNPLWELPPQRRLELLRFNNVASAVRAEVFREIDFPILPFGEDFAWAARVLNAGWTVRFSPEAVVQHAHRYSPAQAFERYRIDAAFHREIHGHQLRPTLASVLRGVAYELREDCRFLSRESGPLGLARCLPRAVGLRSAQILGQYWGSRGLGAGFWPKEQRGAPGSSR